MFSADFHKLCLNLRADILSMNQKNKIFDLQRKKSYIKYIPERAR